jgi:hypothetical protein
MDIFEIEERGMFSPPNGNQPQSLPDLWSSAPGEEVRTDLPELTIEELNALGWKGPIEMPPLPGTSYFTHNYEWNSETREYDAIELNELEKRSKVLYQKFWDDLINTSAYTTIKATASQSLEVNTVATEFIALLSDAKNNHANVEKIQEVLVEIMENIPFSEEELQEIQTVFTESGMFAVYTLN